MTNENTKAISDQIHKTVDEIRALRDAARVKLHLASMDARAAWDRLEPKIEEAEHDAANASVAALKEVEATAKKLRDLVASL